MTVERATKNVGWVFGLYLVRRLIRVGYLASFARILAARGLGSYYFLLTLIGMCSLLSAVGTKVLLIRRVSTGREGSEDFISRCFGFNLFSSMVFAAGVMIAAPLTGYDGDVRLGMILMGLTIVPLALVALTHAVSVAHETLWVYALLDNVVPLIEAGIGLVLLFSGYGLVALCALHLVLFSLYAVLFFVMTRRRVVRIGFAVDVRAWAGYLKQSWKIAAGGIQAVLYRRFGILVLSAMSGNVAVGFFAAAMALMEVVQAGANAVRSALFPYMVRAWERDPDELNRFQESCVRLFAALAVPVGLLAICLAQPVLGLIFGKGFHQSVRVLQVLSWTLFPMFLEPILAQVCYAAGRLHLPAIGYGIMNAVRIALCIALVLWFHERPAEGLAWAMLISALVGFVIYVMLIRRYIGRIDVVTPLLRVSAASMTPVLALIFLGDHLHPCLLAPTLVVLFAAGATICRVFTTREFEILGRAVRSFRNRRRGGAASDTLDTVDAES